jgi:hypothetical protein
MAARPSLHTDRQTDRRRNLQPMDNRLPLAILFSALMAAVLPLAAGLYLHGHMNLSAVLKNAFG